MNQLYTTLIPLNRLNATMREIERISAEIDKRNGK